MVIMKHKASNIKLFIINLLLFVSTSAFTADNSMVWGILNWPPWQYVEHGEIKGYSSALIKIMQGDLPGYKHDFLAANMHRLAVSLNESDKMCVVNWFLQDEVNHLPRTTFPDMIYLSQGLIMLPWSWRNRAFPNSAWATPAADR